jgi:prepilin-type N-terminal cleavage/methylation domain-containing protein
MKLSLSQRNRSAAFTLPEIIIVVAIFSLLVLATVSSQIFGLRMYRISEAKLTTTANARKAVNRIREEVRAGKLLYVGNGDSVTFKLVADNAPHLGNALRICATTDTNNYVYYFVDPVNASLNRMESGSKAVKVVANYITNAMAFRAEDFQGNVVTNYQNNRVIRLLLQFNQREYSNGKASMYDYYQLQTRIARRSIE